MAVQVKGPHVVTDGWKPGGIWRQLHQEPVFVCTDKVPGALIIAIDIVVQAVIADGVDRIGRVQKTRSVAAPVTTSMSNHSVGVLTNCTMAVVHSRGASTVSWLKFLPADGGAGSDLCRCNREVPYTGTIGK